MAALDLSDNEAALIENVLAPALEDALADGVTKDAGVTGVYDPMAGYADFEPAVQTLLKATFLSTFAALVRATVGTWTEVSAFSNSWVNFGGALETAGYVKAGSVVSLKGTVKSGTVGQSAFTLPTGYRPAGTVRFAIPSNGAFGIVEIAAAGTVKILSGSNVYASLDGINFKV